MPGTSPPAPSPSAVQIRSFRIEDAPAFQALNEEWIARYFGIEPQDRELLGNPVEHILNPGGYIFVAELHSAGSGAEVVGCCALIPRDPALFGDRHMLLGKMAVSPRLRDLGIGRKLLSHTIAEARSLDLRIISLETSARLANAIHLYASLGFRHIPPERIVKSALSRADVYMELPL